ncbi:MAG: AAA family ATPase, partial [Planctomycetia bacterium]|nr:AAA family ATPase [Planctomycetia bacterium]
MSQRERLASGTVSEPAPRPTVGHPAALRPAPASDATASPLPWEDYFRAATPARQKELLALAAAQGVVYAHQLTPHANGSADGTRHLLAQVLAGRTDELEPVATETVAWLDAALDEDQREAVARALATPDCCLIQGLPGTGKTRTLTEIAAQAVQRGQRVLLLAFSSAALDRMLEPLAAHETVAPIRCLARGERPEDVSPTVRALTFAERLRCLTEQAPPAARRQAEEADSRCRQRERDLPVLSRLLELADRRQQLASRQAQLDDERARHPGDIELLAQTVESGTSGAADAAFVAELQQAIAERKQASIRIDEKRAELGQQAAEREKQAEELEQQLTALVPFAQARQQGRWWSWTWWQAASQGDVVGKLTELETRKQQLARDRAALTESHRQLDDELAAAEQGFRTRRAACCQSENDRRQQDSDRRLQTLRDEQ